MDENSGNSNENEQNKVDENAVNNGGIKVHEIVANSDIKAPPETDEIIKKTNPNEKIVQQVIEEEMKKSYIAYSMSVIVGRALPDVRDGLKPVHRRVLYSMHELGLQHSKVYKKCARIVGEVLGKYHPHGDTAVYDSLVRMAQPFSLRYTLVDGQGNFGSVDGDNAAAMRYTEARMSRIAEEMLTDIEKETVDFQDNFDASLKEPKVLPARIPNLLINGSSGIAVGMATNIPPHNVGEVVDAVIKVIDNKEIDMEELILAVPGPDFPTGGIICGKKGIEQAYKYGRGKIIVRGRAEIVEEKKKNRIIVHEIPYMVNKSTLIEGMANLVRDKKITGISDIRDESDREGMRIVIELKNDATPQVILNQLFKHTNLQVTFGAIMLALVDNIPKVLNLKEIIVHYIDYRKEIVTKRTQFELKKAKERVHVLIGLIIALDNVDEIVSKIKASQDAVSAANMLMSDYSLSDIQSKAILDMKLQKLASLEQQKIRIEHDALLKSIKELEEILGSESSILEIIKKELLEVSEKYSDERRTEISNISIEESEIDIEDLIQEEKVVITITNAGYIKRTSVNVYRGQRRGGKGVLAATTKEEDFVSDVFTASTHSYILFFTDKGKVYWLKAYNIPEASRIAKGKPIVNLISLGKDEKITAFVPVREFDDKHFLMLATKQGIVKKTNLSEYGNPRVSGIIAIKLDDNDKLINAKLTDGNKDVFMATKNGLAIRFNEENARAIGRASRGVRGISLKNDDEVVSMGIANDNEFLLTITENGYGKRTGLQEYRQIGRAGMGVINIQCTERNGKVVAVQSVCEGDDLMFITKNGITIRTSVNGISSIGRNTQGVTLMKLDGDKVVAAAVIKNEEELESPQVEV
jgi:DNA gyrase subunit A